MVRSCGVSLQHWRWEDEVMSETDVLKKRETNVLSFKQESQVLLSVIVGTHGILASKHFSQ